MYLLQATNLTGISLVLFLGTLGMLVLTIGLILFIIFHQRKVIRYQLRLTANGAGTTKNIIKCFYSIAGRRTSTPGCRSA